MQQFHAALCWPAEKRINIQMVAIVDRIYKDRMYNGCPRSPGGRWLVVHNDLDINFRRAMYVSLTFI